MCKVEVRCAALPILKTSGCLMKKQKTSTWEALFADRYVFRSVGCVDKGNGSSVGARDCFVEVCLVDSEGNLVGG